MVGEPVKIAAPQTTGIKMVKPGIGAGLADPNPELREKIVSKLV
jgi:hypothetical protein